MPIAFAQLAVAEVEAILGARVARGTVLGSKRRGFISMPDPGVAPSKLTLHPSPSSIPLGI